jgi:hypothetical protein
MYTSIDFSNEIVVQKGSLDPTNKGSHTPIRCLDWS